MRATFALSFVLAACGARSPTPTTPVADEPAGNEPAPTAFVPRIVRTTGPVLSLGLGVGIEVDGVRRVAGGDGYELHVVDPEAGVELARERVTDVYAASLDPSLRRVCVEMREMRAGAPTEIGAYDLERRVFLWREVVVAEGQPGTVLRALGTPDRCLFVLRTDLDTLLVRGLEDGAPLDAAGIEVPETGADTTVVWSRDRSTFVLSRPATSASGVSSLSLDVRDGRTLARRAQLWARCVEAGAALRITPDDAVEDEARRSYLARILPDLLGPCTPRPPAAARTDVMSLPAPWTALSTDVVAVHADDGLFVWDHGHLRAPLRVEGAPPLVRFRDVNGSSRPLEPVAPPDGSWIGVVTEDGRLVRYDPSGAALDPLSLPLDPPTDADEAEWQVFAGARGRLLALRHVRDHRTAFVGDGIGPWVRSPARAFPMIRASAAHEDARGTWLLSDPHYGISRIDEETGRVRATFLTSDTWSRTSVATPSPDGIELFVAVAAAESDDDGGLFFLDAETLALRRRFPAIGAIDAPTTMIAWGADGVLLPAASGRVLLPSWTLLDPASGEVRSLARGALRIDFVASRRGPVRVTPAFEGGAFVGAETGLEERWVFVEAGGAAIDDGGRVWCEGTGCDHFRCVVGPDDARPVDDPACASLRLE